MFLFFHCAYKVKTGAEMKEANTVSVSDLHEPFTDEAQTALFKDPVRTAQ